MSKNFTKHAGEKCVPDCAVENVDI